MATFLANSPTPCSAALKAWDNRECAYCYESLTKKQTAQLLDKAGEIVCCHLYHVECLHQAMVVTVPPVSSSSFPYTCLVCSKGFESIKVIPDLKKDPLAWFQYFDTNGDGSVSYQELIDGLKGQIDLDFHQIEADVDSLFPQWDKDKNGVISYEEFIDEVNGVLSYLICRFPLGPKPEPPSLEEDIYEWFAYWDDDESDSLDKSEITRALIKTFRIYNIDRSTIAQIVEKVWPVFDLDDSGVIEIDEFTATDNLGEALLAQIILETRGVEALQEEYAV